MNLITFSFKTVTHATKARRALKNKKIRSKLVKLDPSNSPNGCSYGLLVSEEMFYSVVAILRTANIHYSVIEGRADNGLS